MHATTGLRASVRSGQPSIGAWANLVEPRVAAAMARAGFDWVCIDQQHGYGSGRDVTDLLGAVHAGGAAALVRVAWNRPEEIGRALDAGADGVIVPMVESAAEARAAVAATRYAPEGRRSWGGARSPFGTGVFDPPAANAATACLVMVESVAALEAVDDIAAVEGVDGVFVGPFDLSLALGIPLQELLDDHTAGSPLQRVAAACRAHGIAAAGYGGALQRSQALHGHGFTMLAVTSDEGLVDDAARDASAQARELLGAAVGPPR